MAANEASRGWSRILQAAASTPMSDSQPVATHQTALSRAAPGQRPSACMGPAAAESAVAPASTSSRLQPVVAAAVASRSAGSAAAADGGHGSLRDARELVSYNVDSMREVPLLDPMKTHKVGIVPDGFVQQKCLAKGTFGTVYLGIGTGPGGQMMQAVQKVEICDDDCDKVSRPSQMTREITHTYPVWKHVAAKHPGTVACVLGMHYEPQPPILYTYMEAPGEGVVSLFQHIETLIMQTCSLLEHTVLMGAFPGWEVVVQRIEAALKALKALHKSRLVHRDLKTGNVLIDPKSNKVSMISHLTKPVRIA